MVEEMKSITKLDLKFFANICVESLKDLKEKVVFAESCTGGLMASTITGIPGTSEVFCGSLVTYRPLSKRKWLSVKRKTIESFTTESHEVVKEMAVGALETTPEAKWSLAIVGHLGPNAPADKDGLVWVCIASRNKDGKIKIKNIFENSLGCTERVQRQHVAVEIGLTFLSRILLNRSNKKKIIKKSA